MALITPSNLYSGAAQVVNEAPHIAFQTRLLQHHQAQQDALDQYYRKLPLTINEKGVRDQDRPDISNGVGAIKGFYIQNRDKLRNGDPATQYNYEKLIRDQQDLVQRSQSAGLTDTQVGKLKFNPTTSYMFQKPDVVNQLNSHHLPVNDPNHVDFDLETFTVPPKPYDRTTYFKNFDQLKGNDNIQKIPNKDGTETVINSPTYEQPQKDYVHEVAADKYMHDPSFKQMVDTDLGTYDKNNPLNNDFKQHFGHDIQTPIDLATAYTFNGLKPLPVTQKAQPDAAAMLAKREQFAREQQARGFANTRSNIRLAAGLKKDAKTDGDVESADAVLHNVYDIINEGEKSDLPNKVGKAFLGGTSDVAQISDPNLLKTFSGIKKVGTTPVPPDNVTFDKSKDQFNLVYNPIETKDDKGQPLTIKGETIPLSGRDYVKMKVRETYPNKEIGQINNIVDKVINSHGGLYKALQIYNPNNKPEPIKATNKEVIKKGKFDSL